MVKVHTDVVLIGRTGSSCSTVTPTGLLPQTDRPEGQFTTRRRYLTSAYRVQLTVTFVKLDFVPRVRLSPYYSGPNNIRNLGTTEHAVLVDRSKRWVPAKGLVRGRKSGKRVYYHLAALLLAPLRSAELIPITKCLPSCRLGLPQTIQAQVS